MTTAGPLCVALDVQHIHKPPPRANDRGARFVYPATGLHYNETELAREYADRAERALWDRGARVLTNAPHSGFMTGWYRKRARDAAAWGAHVYLACHVNAGRGRYAMVGHWKGQASGRIIAGMMAHDLGRLPEISEGQVWQYTRLRRGNGTIRHAHARGMAAVLVEPFFGDTLAHLRGFLDPVGPQVYGAIIAGAVSEWWENFRDLQ